MVGPAPRVDMEASLRVWGVEYSLAGRVVVVPPLPAADWLPVLASADSGQLLDRILPVDDTDLDEALLSGRIGVRELATAVSDVVEAVTGRPLHTAVMLAVVAVEHWGVVGGDLARHGFRWDAAPIGAALDAVYATIVERLPDGDRERFDRALRPPLTSGNALKSIDRPRAFAAYEALARAARR